MNKQQTILIVEDNEMNMDIASRLLERQQYKVIKAADGDTGIDLAKKHVPDLILMDIHLPNKDGFEICQLLKNDHQTQHIKIIAFTALVMEKDKERALASGCSGVISKPIDVESFARTVAFYL